MRSFLSSKNRLFLIFIFILLVGGCSGATGEGDSTEASDSSGITYKLGISADGYTALSLASSSGEALIVIAASLGSNEVRYVIVRASNGESALLAFLYGNNFPDVMISGDHSWLFKNYNGSTADITYVAPDGTRTTTTGVSVARSTGTQRVGAASGNPDLFRGEISDAVWNSLTAVKFATCGALILTPGAGAFFCGVTIYDVAAKTEGLQPSLTGKLTNFIADSSECNYEQWFGNTGYYQCMDEIRGQTNAAPIDTDGNSTDSIYRGSIGGSWRATGDCEGLADGTFIMNIASNGAITGTYTGSDSGSITGLVDNTGNFSSGSGGATGGGWSGSFIRNGGDLSGSGTWSAFGCSGTWSGTGSATQ